MEYLTDPVSGSPAAGKVTCGVLCLHVDDLCMAGDSEFQRRVVDRIKQDFEIGSEDLNVVEYCGQKVQWIPATSQIPAHIAISQNKAIDALTEIRLEGTWQDNTPLTPTQHTQFRSVLGQINWLQSRTQFQAAYGFSRCASAAAKPLIKDLRELNKLVRMIKARPVILKHFPLKGALRIVSYPDASYRNNTDKSSQRGMVTCLAEPRTSSASSRGCVIAFESHKIKRTTLSTTVAELYAFMKAYGTAQFIRGLWMDISSQIADLHMRTDANNLVTTASTTHLPEQQETIHMIQMLRKESTSGQIDDLGHVRTVDMLADCLTKASAKPDALLRAVDTGILPNVDASPSFRSLLKHKAYAVAFLSRVLDTKRYSLCDVTSFLGDDISSYVQCYLASPTQFTNLLDGSVGPDAPEEDSKNTYCWHTHACAFCQRSFTHFHDCDADFISQDHTHREGEFTCCHVGCPQCFQRSVNHQHNPHHARAAR